MNEFGYRGYKSDWSHHQTGAGMCLITRDGQEFELKAQGWNPLKEK